MPSTPVCRNASTCGFSARKGRCARGSRNLPHTSVHRFRKRGEKTEICRPDPGFTLPRPAFLLPKVRLCSEVSDFSPALPENTATPIVPKRKPLRIPLEKQPFNAKTAYRRFPRTKPDIPSQGLITVGTLRKNPISVNPLPASRSEIRLSSNASVKLHVSRKTPATTSFPNWDVSFDRPNLTSKQKRGPTHQPSSGVARRLPPQLTLF